MPGLAMATQLMMSTVFSCCSTRREEVLSLSALHLTSSSSSGMWKSLELSTKNTNRRVEFGQSSRRRITRDVQALGRRGRAGGRPTNSPPSGTSSRGRSSYVQQQQQQPEFQAKKTKQEDEDEDDALAEAALEALFAQLEKDLEDGAMSDEDDSDEDFTEEEVLAFEDELEAALMGLGYNQPSFGAGKNDGDASTTKPVRQDDELLLDNEEEDEEEQRVVSLETWQLKKLAAAAEIGRRHVNVKALAAELGMDRTDVLAWLRNPPPELLMVGASMGLEEESEEADQIDEEIEEAAVRNSSKDSVSASKENSEGLSPVTWYRQKRLRKEHIATFERVFRETRRPTNSMIQNLVELTHVPRKRIVEWFDQKRQEVEPSRSFESLR